MHTTTPRRGARELLAAAALLALAACGKDHRSPTQSDLTPVIERIFPQIAIRDGFVYVDGKNLAGATVQFRNATTQALTPATVTASTATRLTVRVPSTLDTQAAATVVVTTAKGHTESPPSSKLYVVENSAFGNGLLEGKGLVGRVYALPDTTTALPNLGALTPQSMILAPNLDVAARQFTEGFPGVPGGLVEWFGIRFDGILDVPAAGSYGFMLYSDDGTKLWIDEQLVVSDDGVHGMQSATGQVDLTAGHHRIRIDYFQGPRYVIGVQLFWTPPGGAQQIVPADRFLLPDLATIFPS